MNHRLIIEGGSKGANSKNAQIRSREGVTEFLTKAGLSGRLPRIILSGPRSEALKHFCLEVKSNSDGGFIALLIDSEEPVVDSDQPWVHIQRFDQFSRPFKVSDEQLFLMVTCMETWLVADRDTLKDFFGEDFQPTALPSLTNLETKSRDAVQQSLGNATRQCKKQYRKGECSFELLGKANPAELEKHLPSVQRFVTILRTRLT